MAYGDGFAAIAGKAIKSKEYTIFGCKKTIAGSSVMFVVSLIITLGVFCYSNTEWWLIKSLILSIIATILEAISAKGTDNITVPVVASLLTYFVI